MLKCFHVEQGGWGDSLTIFVFDDVKNEITYYTESQIEKKIAKEPIEGIQGIRGIQGGYRLNINTVDVEGIRLEKINTLSKYYSGCKHSSSCDYKILVDKPYKITKFREGIIFEYMNLCRISTSTTAVFGTERKKGLDFRPIHPCGTVPFDSKEYIDMLNFFNSFINKDYFFAIDLGNHVYVKQIDLSNIAPITHDRFVRIMGLHYNKVSIEREDRPYILQLGNMNMNNVDFYYFEIDALPLTLIDLSNCIDRKTPYTQMNSCLHIDIRNKFRDSILNSDVDTNKTIQRCVVLIPAHTENMKNFYEQHNTMSLGFIQRRELNYETIKGLCLRKILFDAKARMYNQFYLEVLN